MRVSDPQRKGRFVGRSPSLNIQLQVAAATWRIQTTNDSAFSQITLDLSVMYSCYIFIICCRFLVTIMLCTCLAENVAHRQPPMHARQAVTVVTVASRCRCLVRSSAGAPRGHVTTNTTQQRHVGLASRDAVEWRGAVVSWHYIALHCMMWRDVGWRDVTWRCWNEMSRSLGRRQRASLQVVDDDKFCTDQLSTIVNRRLKCAKFRGHFYYKLPE